MKKILCLTLAILLTLTCLSGCSSDKPEEAITTTAAETEGPKRTGEPVEGKYLVQGGETDYVLVIPENPMDYEKFAAEEFTTFLEMATGCKIETVDDTETEKITGHYISIGVTQQVKSTYPDLKIGMISGDQSSYYLASQNDNIYVVSPPGFQGAGTLYGVYDLLHDLIGYTYYDETEIYVDETADVKLWNYEAQFVYASIDMRTHSTSTIYTNDTYNTRLRYINFSRGSEWNALTNGHSQLMAYLHPSFTNEDGSRYGGIHPEWFVDPFEVTPALQTNQLCWTAGGDPDSLKEMQQVIADKLIEFLQMDTKANYFMFGQHDNKDACSCPGCQKALEEWAGTYSGLQISFFNGVLDIVNEWQEVNQPGREVFYVIYAYSFTEAPPVKQNEDGTYAAFSDQVIPDERMKIMWAPVSANYAFTFDSPINVKNGTDLAGWKAICSSNQLFTYLYDLNLWYYFINFYNFGTVQSMVQQLQDAGCSYLLIQGPSDQANVPGFQALRAYCTANIMWDSSRNYQELAADFITHYYKDAAGPMQELFDMICERNAYYSAALDVGNGTINAYPTFSELYPKAFTEQMDARFQTALQAIAHYENEDPALYQELTDRIMKEYLCVIFLKATVYGDYYTDDEINEMRETWDYYIKRFGITGGGEGSPLPNF